MLERVDNAWLKQFAARAAQLGALDVSEAEWRRSQLWERVHGFLERYQLLLLPSTQTAAFPKEIERPTTIDGEPAGDVIESSLSTYAISITGLPGHLGAVRLHVGWPAGLQIVGRWRREADVLRAAAAFEDAAPWAHHRPPLAVAPGRRT